MDPQHHYRLALRSPALVGAKDRNGWVDLFHPEGFVEDPVDAGRYEGTPNIETFWDVFIGPQPSVRFDVRRDFWGGDTLIRQATVVSVTQADPDQTLDVPALICYSLRDGRVGSLQAIWEPRHVVGWFLKRGGRGLWALSRHGIRMVGQAGLRNGLSFGGTVVGGLGRPRAQALVDALRSGEASRWSDVGATRSMVGHAEDAQVFEGDPAPAIEALQAHAGPLSDLEVDQLLLCGRHVGVFLAQPSGGGALALMLQTSGDGQIDSLTALWSPQARVLSAGTDA